MQYNADFYVEKLLNYYNVSTISELAQILDTKQTSISSWRSRNSINAIKKKCREIGIYNEIFGDSNTFTQHGSSNQQIGKQTNHGGNNFGSVDVKTQNIDEDILKLVEALNSVANALDKKEELKQELTKLIKILPDLQ